MILDLLNESPYFTHFKLNCSSEGAAACGLGPERCSYWCYAFGDCTNMLGSWWECAVRRSIGERFVAAI